MEIIVQIFKQLPPVWPRLVLVVAIAGILLFPQTRRFLTRGGTGTRKLDRAKRLLEVRRLELEVAALRAKTPESGASLLDPQIEAILGQVLEEEVSEEAPPLPWLERLKFASVGALAFLVVSLLVGVLVGDRSGLELAKLATTEFVLLVPCTLLAASIPSNAGWISVFYGLLGPVLLAAISVAARGGV